jgi:adenylate kinase
MISRHFHIPAVSTGALLRAERASGSEIGREADCYTREGRLFPDSIALAVVESWLDQNNGSFLFDGFPRTLSQAEAFDALLQKRDAPLHVVIELDLKPDEIRSRILSRLTCESCGATFSTRLHELKIGDACPVCGHALSRRNDDTEEALEVRLRQHHALTDPVAEYYRAAGILRRVDASPGAESIFRNVSELLSGGEK